MGWCHTEMMDCKYCGDEKSCEHSSFGGGYAKRLNDASL